MIHLDVLMILRDAVRVHSLPKILGNLQDASLDTGLGVLLSTNGTFMLGVTARLIEAAHAGPIP